MKQILTASVIAIACIVCLAACKSEEVAKSPQLTIVLDMSSSALGKIDDVAIMDMEFAVARALIDSLEAEVDYGFTVFAGQWSNVEEPKLNASQAQNLINQLEALRNASTQGDLKDGSAIYSALLSASIPLMEIEGPSSILLITDGDDNCSNISAGFLSQWMQDHGIRVDVVSISCQEGETIKHHIDVGDGQTISMPGNQDFRDLVKLTRATNGAYHHITSMYEAEDIIEPLLSTIRQSESPTERPDSTYIDTSMRGWLQQRITDEAVTLF